MKLIPLKRGQSAQVDDEDFKWLSAYNWCCAGHPGKFYAVRSFRFIKGGAKHYVYMHRDILGVSGRGKNHIVDHKDGNSLNNQKCNLRGGTQSDNIRNTVKTKGVSQYKGVSFSKSANKWQALIQYDKKRYHLGYYTDEKMAALVRDETVKILYGEFAVLNFLKI